MTLLIVYVALALVFSFLCSIFEAVLLSTSKAHITLMEQQERSGGKIMRQLKEDINKPLAAILTLNTIAHTVGAAGAGAQAAAVFGSNSVGLASAILTLLILVFSEIIPKTLGANYWRHLSGLTAHSLKVLVWILYPFVWMSEKFTRNMSQHDEPEGFSREEFAAMAELGEKEGQLQQKESQILRNIFLLHETPVTAVMTPRPVVFSLSEEMTVDAFFTAHYDTRFSRIPIYENDREHLVGFVLKGDLLLGHSRGNSDKKLKDYCRDLKAMPETKTVYDAFEYFIQERLHIMMIVDEYGGMEGIITLEDILETLLGLEIMDEKDKQIDMQEHARQLWRRRARAMGLEIPAKNSGLE
ncbi:MAG: hemolysin [Gammaproteobacteria bacterium]|nr:hemolysin [Gammaproteobacteria bacterium]MAY01424.1 hemolysin [Gammaproteobacteria bacterium]|tara:strand:+ start:152 stop:1219 length:1068 start_codon:yes stop_codon:yes gene_type:complete